MAHKLLIINTLVGKLGIKINTGKITKVIFNPTEQPCIFPTDDFSLNYIHNQLQQYFINPKYKFVLSLAPQGTVFQQRVWHALGEIPSGTTKTYAELAKQLHTGPRAVGNACRSNPIPIIIPCHRVVARNSLGGFGGEQQGKLLDIKKWLLRHEASPSLTLPLKREGH